MVDAGVFIEENGFAVDSILETLDWELQANSTLQARHKHLPVVTFRLLNTHALTAGIINEHNKNIDDIKLNFSQTFPLFTGDARLVIPGGAARQCFVRVLSKRDIDGPITILGLFPEVVIPE